MNERFYVHRAVCAPSEEEAKRMSEIFNQYYPTKKCDGYDIKKVYNNQKADIVIARDRKNHFLIAGFMITIPVDRECFSNFMAGEIFGTGESPCPSVVDDEKREFFIIDCLMMDKTYQNIGTAWPDMIVKSVEYMNKNSVPEAIVSAASDLDTGDSLYKDILSMSLAKDIGRARIYTTTLRNLTYNVKALEYIS